MDAAQFTEKKTGELVKTSNAGWAFVPEPLKPIVLDMDTVALLSEADAASSELAGLSRTISNPWLVVRPVLRQEALLSSKMEGTFTTARQLALFEVDGAAVEEESRDDTHEVWNYISAMEHGLKQLGSMPICLRLIKQLHSILMDGVRGEDKRPGEFRSSQNAIGKEGQTEQEARFVPPPVKQMLTCLHDLEAFIHATPKTVPPLIKAAMVHYQFETIHPFSDGNGRIGRLLIPLMLIADRRLPQPLLYLSEYFEAHDRQYRDGLLAVSTDGAWRPWIRFFLTAVVEQSRKAVARVAKLHDLAKSYRSALSDDPGPVAAIADGLFSRAVISAEDVMKRHKVTHTTAMNYIRRLMAKRILIEYRKVGKKSYYIAPEIISVAEAKPEKRDPS